MTFRCDKPESYLCQVQVFQEVVRQGVGDVCKGQPEVSDEDPEKVLYGILTSSIQLQTKEHETDYGCCTFVSYRAQRPPVLIDPHTQ